MTQGALDGLDAAWGFVERFDGWTGRGWLQIRGPQPRWVRMDAGYTATRRWLRSRFPDRPFTSEWALDGRFPTAPLGGPAHLIHAIGWAVVVAALSVACWLGGAGSAAVVGVGGGWLLVRMLDGVAVHRRGLAVGPPWVAVIPWHDVLEVVVEPRRRHLRVWAHTVHGAWSGTVPAVLLPALRARVRRLSGLQVRDNLEPTTLRYAAWRSAARSLPVGALLVVVVAPWTAPDPWAVIAAGLPVVAGLTLLGAAVHARATGWGMGAVLWMIALYTLVSALWVAAVGL